MDPTDKWNAKRNVWWCISTLLKPRTLYKGNFKKYKGKFQKSVFWHFELLNYIQNLPPTLPPRPNPTHLQPPCTHTSVCQEVVYTIMCKLSLFGRSEDFERWTLALGI